MKTKTFNGIFIFFGALLAIYSLFFAGFEAGQHDYAAMGANLITAALWIILVVAMVASRLSDVRMEVVRHHLEALDQLMQDMAELAKTEAATPVKPPTKIEVKQKGRATKVEVRNDEAAARAKRRAAGIKGAANRKARLAKEAAAKTRSTKKG